MPFLDGDALDVLKNYCGDIVSRDLAVIIASQRPALIRRFESHGLARAIQLTNAIDESELEPRRTHRCRHNPTGDPSSGLKALTRRYFDRAS